MQQTFQSKKSEKRLINVAAPAAKKEKNNPSQAERVFDYLVSAGRKGATNFEMMVNLRICDVRKRISELNELLWEYTIESEYEESNNGKRYKRYWAVPREYADLAEYLNETKRARSITPQSTGGGRR